MFTKNKGIVIAVAVFIVAMLAYNLFFKSEAVSLPNESATVVIGEDLIKIYKELQGVTLDQSFFSSAGYLLLQDFSNSIPQQATGRPNPFNIIGRD
jgi:hypothetical protein